MNMKIMSDITSNLPIIFFFFDSIKNNDLFNGIYVD